VNLAARYRRKESVVERSIAGESFLIPVCGTPVEMENIFVLNELGAFIWRRLDGGSALSDIVGAIREQYDVAREEAESDLSDLIKRMLAAGLIEESA
jgi:hypothetical protein